eukprot:832978-Rhodomonas_salina.1
MRAPVRESHRSVPNECSVATDFPCGEKRHAAAGSSWSNSDDGRPVRGERNAEHAITGQFNVRDRAGVIGSVICCHLVCHQPLPLRDHSISASGENVLPIVCEHDGADGFVMLPDHDSRVTSLLSKLVQAQAVVRGPSDDPRAGAIERTAQDGSGVQVQGLNLLSEIQIPHLDHLFGAARH